jgi:hypothetical protein
MKGMDADCYVVEYAIRDRLLDAREKARTAALLLQANDLPCSKGIETRRVGFGRALVGRARGVGAAISHALPGRAQRARHPQVPLPARRGS